MLIILISIIALIPRAICKDAETIKDLSICGSDFFPSSEMDTNMILRSDTPETLRMAEMQAQLFILPNRTLPRHPIHCSFELQTCGLCRIRIDYKKLVGNINDRLLFVEKLNGESCSKLNTNRPCFELIFIEDRADSGHLLLMGKKSFRSVSIWDNSATGQYNSTAYKLRVELFMWNVDHLDQLWDYIKQLFPLEVTVFDNTEVIRGHPSEMGLFVNKSSLGFITSPRYPHAYPRGVHKNFTLINTKEDGRVRLIFYDFQLHFQSEMKVIDSDGQELLNTRKLFGISTSRPSTIQSKGRRLTVLFSGKEYTHEVGFRAKYQFVANEYWPKRPDPRSCDDLLENFGGKITIASKNLQVNSYIDCVWVIGKFPYPSQAFNRLYLKVEDFNVQTNSAGIHLDIRRGRTSISERMLLVFGPRATEQLAGIQPQEGFITDLKDRGPSDFRKGFYVRLRGYLGSYTGLAISYVQFYRWATAMCPGGDEFHCDNSRCIKRQLTCDLHDHCGDSSDEDDDLCSRNPFRPKTGGILQGEERQSSMKVKTGLGNGFVNLMALLSGVVLLVLIMLLMSVAVARVYRQRLIRRFRREVADLTMNRQTGVQGERSKRCVF